MLCSEDAVSVLALAPCKRSFILLKTIPMVALRPWPGCAGVFPVEELMLQPRIAQELAPVDRVT
jgi:hypothetical protein